MVVFFRKQNKTSEPSRPKAHYAMVSGRQGIPGNGGASRDWKGGNGLAKNATSRGKWRFFLSPSSVSLWRERPGLSRPPKSPIFTFSRNPAGCIKRALAQRKKVFRKK